MINRRAAMLALGLALAWPASFALFASLQNATAYVAAARGQFYSPLPNEGFTGRATDPRNLALLRFSALPFLIFLIFEFGSAYSFSVPFHGARSHARGLALGLLMSACVTGVGAMFYWVRFAQSSG